MVYPLVLVIADVIMNEPWHFIILINSALYYDRDFYIFSTHFSWGHIFWVIVLEIPLE